MICDNCRKAGRYNAQANLVGPPGERVLRESAEGWHELCTDIICPCAHVVGRVINPAYVPVFNPDFGSSDQ